jgi:MYXO-CTERM domain-containing protein
MKNLNTMTLLAAGTCAMIAASAANAAVVYSSALKAPPLNVGALAGQDSWTVSSGTSNAVQVGSTGTTLVNGGGSREDLVHALTQIGTGQTYYVGFDVTVSAGANVASSTYFMAFNNNTNYATRMFVTSSSGSNFTFGLSGNSNTAVAWGTGLTFGTTYRVVGSYTQGTNVTNLWVNPSSAASTSITSTASGATNINSILLRQDTGISTQLVSNMVVATSFAEAATFPVPAPGAIALLGVAGLVGSRRRR